MRVLSLNLWGGRLYDVLVPYINTQKKTVDIFCFQEVFDDTSGKVPAHEKYRPQLLNELKALLPEFACVYAPCIHGHDYYSKQPETLSFGQATFVKKTSPLLGHQIKEIHKDNETEPTNRSRRMLVVQVKHGKKDLFVGNLHGFWIRDHKADCPERIAQSQAINEFFKDKPHHLFVGDFNLDLPTQSIKMLEEGRQNLIRESGVTSTRSSHFTYKVKFADYAFASSDITITHFSVDKTEVSDHLPLIVEF